MPSAATIPPLLRTTPSPLGGATSPCARDSPPSSPRDQLVDYNDATEKVLANAQPGETIATTKEEEWVTRKKSEVTTTRQIETRVKREVVLEDGRVLSDSGPKISTSTHEDTHTTNFHQSEHRALDPQSGDDEDAGTGLGVDQIDGPVGTHARVIENGTAIGADGTAVAAPVSTVVTTRVVDNPEGKVRESHSRRQLTHHVTDHLRETEEEFHMGDTTHQAFITAVNETEDDDIRDALTRRTSEVALVSRGPRLVHESTAFSKTVDTEDTDELRALKPDGTIVTETKRATEHEHIKDEDLPANEARSLASNESATRERSGRERRARVDTEIATELMAGGRRLGGHVHSRTRTEEAVKEGDPKMEDSYDWDSLSMRMRRQRRLRYNEHDAFKDSYAKRPIDFDIEEETRKKETSKWLENHFGSESRSSHDSIAEEIGRRAEPSYFNVTIKSKATAERDEGYYGKPAATGPPPPLYDRSLRKTKSSTPSDERDVPSKTGGYFKGVADWSQRRVEKPRMPEPRSASPSPPTARSPYASADRLDRVSPKRGHSKRDSLQEGGSPSLGRRGTRPPPSDSAYVSSSTVHSPPRSSPFRNDRDREPSLEEDYRQVPVVPERKRNGKHRAREEQRYDSGYRSSSRNETSGRSRDSEGASEPPPDYSPPPPRERRASPEPSPQSRRRDERKQNQKTRFAAESARKRSPARKLGSAIGDSIRKLVGKIRSASAERRARRRSAAASRSPSPADHTSRTYRPYDADLAPPPAPAQPPQRYYLGEDPFAGSIYGREHKYEGASPRRTAAHDKRNGNQDHRSQFTSTLGRFSHSTSRLNPNIEQEEEYTRSAQTLPRKLQVKREKKESTSSSEKRWHQLGSGKRSTSAVNVSVVNVAPHTNGKVTNGHHQGPAKPARTYKALNRSKSFAMGAPETETNPRYVSGMSRNYSTMYKSNPHLSRLDETPEQLKSPGIVSIINRSQRDLADAVSREAEKRRDGLFGARYGKAPYTNGHINGRHDETDKKKLFMKGLKERAPELFQTLHGEDESDGSRLSSRYGTPSPSYAKERISEERRLNKSSDYSRDTSPYVTRFGNVDSRIRSPDPRRGSNSSDNFSETYRYRTKSEDPDRPSVTDTVETISKKVLPTRDGRGKEIIESREMNSVTTSRFKGEPLSNFKYIENGSRLPSLESRASPSPLYSERRSSNYKVTEKVRDFRH